MELLIKIMQSTAMMSGLIAVNVILIVVFTAFMWYLICGRATCQSTKCENANVDVQAGDWLLAIVKFSGFIILPIILVFLTMLIRSAYEVICWRYGFKMEETFELFVLGVFGIFILGLGLFGSIGLIKLMAKDSASARS